MSSSPQRSAGSAFSGDPAADDRAEGANARSEQGPVRQRDLPRLFRYGDLLINALLAALLALMLVVVGANIFGRYVLSSSIAWSDEAARAMFVWLIFLGAALAHFRHEHIAVAYFVEKAPKPVQLMAAAVREIVVLAILGVLLWGALLVMGTTFGATALLRVPFNLINAAVPVAAALMMLMSLYRLVRLATTREV